jgi:branched-chain amino acid aminotransferase
MYYTIKLVINFDETGRKQPDVLIYFVRHRYPSSALYRNGVCASLLSIESIMPNAKFVNSAVMTAVNRELLNKSIYETLLVNNEGFITEGSKSNKKGASGITGKYVFNICNEQNIRFIEQNISINNLNKYSTLFLSGTSAKILPVRGINDIFYRADNSILRQFIDFYKPAVAAFFAVSLNMLKYCSLFFKMPMAFSN